MRWMSIIGLASSVMACQFDSGGFGSQSGTASVPTTEAATASGTAEATSATSVGDADGGSGTAGMTSGSSTTSATNDDAESTTDPPTGCDLQNGGCDPNATCDDTSGRVECTCNPGFEGDGQQCEAAASLPTLRIEIPCERTFCGSYYCDAPNGATDTQMFTGMPGEDYAVTLRFRGVVEEKYYGGGNVDGQWNEGGDPYVSGWNWFRLEVSDPPQQYWLNHGDFGTPYCVPVDYEQTITIAHGAMVTVAMIDDNSCQAYNEDESGTPIVIPDIPPAPDHYPGQFMQVDLVDAVARG